MSESDGESTAPDEDDEGFVGELIECDPAVRGESRIPTDRVFLLTVPEKEWSAARKYLAPRIQGRAIHATTDVGFAGVLKEGAILPNGWTDAKRTVPRFPPTSVQSQHSYSFGNMCISMFSPDCSLKTLGDPGWKYWRPGSNGEGHNGPGDPDLAVLLFLRPEYHCKLDRRSFSEVMWKEPKGAHFCMEGECWFPGPIPLEAIERALEIKVLNLRDPVTRQVIRDAADCA